MSTTMPRTPATPGVLEDPMLNRGVGFTAPEWEALGLTGRLPAAVLTLEQQALRAYQQMQAQDGDLAKNVYLEQLHDRNEVLYYKVLADHLAELLPVVYDPTVGDAIERYSHEYRRPRGIYLSVDQPDDIEKAFATLGLGPGDVDLIVCTDAEEILGIGDWGVGGIAISVGKLAVYTAAAGVDPRRVIPVSLDVGTDNEGLLNDPLYLGNRHARVRGKDYDAFIETYLQVASRLFPGALLHFEDFGANNARRILVAYRDTYRIFNDDMQGTGAVVMAGLFNALKVTGTRWRDQRVVMFGGGTAGVGIADQIRAQMTRDGLDAAQAARQIWIVDLPGLLTDDMGEGLLDYQRPYARPAAEAAGWITTPVQVDPSTLQRWPQMAALRQARAASGIITLETVVGQVEPTVLVGASTAHGAFTQQVIETMSAGVARPVIFPISNPTSQIEAMPADIIAWSKGRALVATGLSGKGLVMSVPRSVSGGRAGRIGRFPVRALPPRAEVRAAAEDSVLLGVACLVSYWLTTRVLSLGRPGDEITAGITTTVVLVVAKLSPHDAWRQPILRLADTMIGVAVGLVAAWLGLRAIGPRIRPSKSPLTNR